MKTAKVFCLLGLCGLSQLLASDLQVPEAVAKRDAISKPPPTISPLARQMRLAGRVQVAVAISARGVVSQVTLVSGAPILGAGVLDAVKHWKFKPFTNPSGEAVTAATTLSFDFIQ